MKIQESIIVAFFLLLISFTGFGQVRSQLEKEIGKIIYYDTEITFEQTPGYLIGIQIGDSTYIYSYGTASKIGGQQPKDSDLFEIGGLTKSFTALLTGLLVEKAVIHLDSSVNTYLSPRFKNPQLAHITIADLVHHTSGLPRLPDGFGLKEKDPNNPFGHYTKTDLMEFYANYYLEPVDKKKYNYSHTNYAILEVVLEFATGDRYENLLREYILEPFGMSHTGINELSVADRNQTANGYTLGGQPTPPWQMQSFAASEGIKSCMADLLKYLRMNIKEADGIHRAVMTKNQQPLIETELTKRTFGGSGWHVITRKNYYDLILHAGSTTGYRSFLGFIPETETGVIILSNSPASMNGLGLLIMRMINNNWRKKKKSYRTKLE